MLFASVCESCFWALTQNSSLLLRLILRAGFERAAALGTNKPQFGPANTRAQEFTFPASQHAGAYYLRARRVEFRRQVNNQERSARDVEEQKGTRIMQEGKD